MNEVFTFSNNGDGAGITPALLQGIFDTIPAGIEMLKAIRDKNNKITDFEYILENEAVRKSPGYLKRVGKRFLSENGNGHEHFQRMAEVVESGKPSHDIFSSKLNGDVQWFEVKYVKSGDAIITFRENITKKKLSEQGTRNDAHFINQIVDTSPEIIYIMDLNTLQTIYTNRQIAVDLGYSKKQIAMMKNPLMDMMWEEDIPAFREHLRKIKTLTSDDKLMEIEYRMKGAKGDIKWFCDRNSVFKRDSRNVAVEKLGFSQDITARKEQEEQLLTGHDILNQAEEITNMGSWEYDILTTNFKWSEGMYRLFNLSRDIRLTPNIYFDYTPDEEKPVVARIVDNIIQSYMAFDEIVTLLPAGLRKKIIRIRAIPVKDKKNNLIKMIGVDLDITPQVKAADEINELNKTLEFKNKDLQTLNKELKTFNTVTSSDYKETLQSLYTNLEYIATKEGGRLGDSSKGNIRKAQAAIQKMKLLTDDINSYLQLYDIGISKSMFDPNPVVNDLISTLKGKIDQANATIELAVLPALPADPYLFSLLLRNLLDNAIKFRKLIAAPLIKIKYSRADEINSVPGALKNTPYIIISVSDNGLGFNEEYTEKIFELFFRIYGKGQYKGSGIGLAICKKIMTMHGGFITAESTPGSGSIFNCYYPMNDALTEKQ